MMTAAHGNSLSYGHRSRSVAESIPFGHSDSPEWTKAGCLTSVMQGEPPHGQPEKWAPLHILKCLANSSAIFNICTPRGTVGGQHYWKNQRQTAVRTRLSSENKKAKILKKIFVNCAYSIDDLEYCPEIDSFAEKRQKISRLEKDPIQF